MNLKNFTIILLLTISSYHSEGCETGTDQYCGQCGSNGSCLICYNTFKSGTTCKEVTTEISNCEQYNDEQTCMKCKDGYFMTGSLGDMSCRSNNIYNCYLINPQNSESCWFCDGYELTSDGLCDTSKSCSGTECRSCELKGSSQVCTMCNQGFVLSSSGTCTAETGALLGCAQVNSENSCVTCRYGYYISSNKDDPVSCVKSPKYESLKLKKLGFIFLLAMNYLLKF